MDTNDNTRLRLSRLLARSQSSSSRGCGAGADGVNASALSSNNVSRSLPKPACSKKTHAGELVRPQRSLSDSEKNTRDTGLHADVSRRLSFSEFVAAGRTPWALVREARETSRRRSIGGDDTRRGGVLRTLMRGTKEEAASRMRVLTARLLQWRFANARLEKAMAGAKSKAENKLFYTWLRVMELQNIVAAKRIVAQRRGQKLKLAVVLPSQLRQLAQWEPMVRQHADAVAALGLVLSAACMSLPLVEQAQANLVPLHESMFTSADTINEIERNAEMLYSKAKAMSCTLGELVKTIQLEIKGLQEAMRLCRIATSLQMQEVSLRANLIQGTHKFDRATIPKPVRLGWSF